jgi:hypothetical protein
MNRLQAIFSIVKANMQGQQLMNVRSTVNGDTCLAAALAHQGIVLQPSFT